MAKSPASRHSRSWFSFVALLILIIADVEHACAQTPPAPTGLTLSTGPSWLTVNWGGISSSASYYLIQRWISGSTTTNSFAEVYPYGSFTDFTVGSGTNYNYSVTAVGTNGVLSSAAGPVSGTPTGPVALFVHPGCLHVLSDYTRMATNVAAGNYPWIESYQGMTNESEAKLNWGAAPVGAIIRSSSGGNFSRCQDDALAIYYLSLEYRITGKASFANAAIAIMNAWSGTVTNVTGDSNFALGSGLCGYEFACAAEELRGYSGWPAASQAAYKGMLVNVFYEACNRFLTQHNNTCDSHYRCNWDACNLAAVIAIGVFCDNTNIFNQAVTYFTNGIGNGNINYAVDFIHPNGLGQWEESGRDQAHTFDGINCEGLVCQIAWNQGVDLYGYDNNLYLRGLEYVCKFNLGNNVPYVHHQTCDEGYDETVVSTADQGAFPYIFEMAYAHYAIVKGIAAPYTAQVAAQLRPDQGITDWNSPDWFGFTSLTFYLGTNTVGSVPTGLMASVAGQQATISWWGSAAASFYNVKRSSASGGPYTTIGSVGPNNTYFVDTGLTAGVTNYYVVSAANTGGESADSTEIAVTPSGLLSGPDDVLSGSVIGTAGSYSNKGTTIANVFDGSLDNFFDGPDATGDWAGLDLGTNVTAVVSNVAYCPRAGYESRMVGGQFQGANDPSFTNPVSLYTITATPLSGVLTYKNVSNTGPFRYLRYLGPANGECDVSEVQFLGSPTGFVSPANPTNLVASVNSAGGVSLSWTPRSATTCYNIERSTNAAGPYLILENTIGTTNTTFFDASTVPGTTYYYSVVAMNAAGAGTNLASVMVAIPFRPVQLTGKIIGTSGSWDNLGNTISNVFDGDLETFFDGPDSSGDWVGLDLGTSNIIAQISYYPRIGYESRMVGGVFQGTVNDPAFASPTIFFTITNTPSDAYSYRAVSNAGSFRYVRYVGPSGGNCNVAELGFYKAAPQPVSLAPVNIGFTVSGKQLQLNWPSDHVGWLLQIQTNSINSGLSTNWATISNSGATNQISIPISETCSSVFLRLVYP